MGRLKILLVDDMPAMRMILKNMLEELGIKTVTEAEDGEMAWQLIRQSVTEEGLEPFDLVIADWNMPGLSGVELLRAVRNLGQTRELPFFIMTAQAETRLIAEALHAGASDYVVKPFNREQLGEKIHAVFPRHLL